MSLHDLGVIAGMVATTLFITSYLPMMVKAARTRDLKSYSASSLLVANIGNLVQSVYVFTLPFGPIWALHTFYLVSTALMMWWWWRYRSRTDDAASQQPAQREEKERDVGCHPRGPVSAPHYSDCRHQRDEIGIPSKPTVG